MKILYFVNYFPPINEAAALNALKIAEYLTKFGHQILVLAPGDMGNVFYFKSSKKLIDSSKIEVKFSNPIVKYPFSFIFSHFENMIKFLINLKSSFSPDMILSQFHPHHYASVSAGYLSKILKLPHIIRSHDLFISDLDDCSIPFKLYNLVIYPLVYKSILNCKIFYVTTSEMRNYLLKFKKLRKVDIKIHHNGIDTTLFYPSNNQEEIKNKFGCDTIFSYIGLITKDLGIHNFLSILPEILKTHKDTHLIIIGHGPYMKYVLNFIKRNKLINQVHFLGIKPHDEIPFYINNCDIGIGRITHKKFVQYGIPIKCLEYMACKKPFITTPVSRDIIENDDVGILLKKNYSQKELLDNMISLIEDKGLRTKLGENGLKKIHQKFRWEEIMNRFNNELLELKF